MGETVLAADLGGTNLRIAAVERTGRIIHRVRRPTPQGEDPMPIVDALVEMAEECRKFVTPGERICFIGIAAPATMDIVNGLIIQSPNLPMLDGLDLSAAVRKRLDCKVLLENDATSAAIGEHWLGASRRFDNSICVTLGTGVGGGIILNGRPLRGPDGTAGELGHICVEPRGYPCPCGSWGCLEQYSSATAVVRTAKELSAGAHTSVLSNRSEFTSEDVYEAALAGDAVAIETFQLMGYYLGLALAGLINVLNPDVIVIGGGLCAAWDMFIESTRDQISKRAFREPAGRVKLVPAELGDDAGILGVASLAFYAADQGILES